MRTSVLLFLLGLSSCSSLPKKRFYLFEWNPQITYSEAGDTARIRLNNPVHCPLKINAVAVSDSARIGTQLSEIFPLVLPPMAQDTLFVFATGDDAGKSKIRWSANYLNGPDSIRTDSFFLPYPYGKSHKIMQGYNGSYSHNNAGAKYALDFALAVGDTVCAAADGYVVGVIEGYSKGGNDTKWMDYANFINLYHPDKNVYTQYVHLRQNGSLVEVGDRVLAGQAIGISGKTGWTSKSHLHFNVIRWENGKRISLPATFGQKSLVPGAEMRKGSRHTNLMRR